MKLYCIVFYFNKIMWQTHVVINSAVCILQDLTAFKCQCGGWPSSTDTALSPSVWLWIVCFWQWTGPKCNKSTVHGQN